MASTFETAPEWMRGTPAVEDWVDPRETPPGAPGDLDAWRRLAEDRLWTARTTWTADHIGTVTTADLDDLAAHRSDVDFTAPSDEVVVAEIAELRSWLLGTACQWSDPGAFLELVGP